MWWESPSLVLQVAPNPKSSGQVVLVYIQIDSIITCDISKPPFQPLEFSLIDSAEAIQAAESRLILNTKAEQENALKLGVGVSPEAQVR